MSLVAQFSTMSGSRYAVCESGAVAVIRQAGHPEGEIEAFTTETIRVSGEKAVLSIKGSTKVLITSVLDLGTDTRLPHAVWQGGTWSVGENPFPPVPHPTTPGWSVDSRPAPETEPAPRRPGAKRGEPGYRPAEYFAPCVKGSHKGGCRCTSSTDCCEGTPVSHDGSRVCKSGSIASGGTRAHCTCDACF